MKPADLVELAARLPVLEYSVQAFGKVKAQFPGPVGKDSADHVVDCIAQIRAENTKLRSAINDLMVPYRDACKGGIPSGVYVQRFRFVDAEKALA